MAKIVRMTIKNLNKENIVVKQMVLKAEIGIIGDVHAGKSLRQISLLRTEIAEAMKGYEGKGLCTKRFTPNLIVEGLCSADLIEGAHFQIGDAVIEISEVGKSCFDNCDLVKERRYCLLSEEAIFAKVIRGGTITVKQEMRKIK